MKPDARERYRTGEIVATGEYTAIVVEENRNPSSDFFVVPALERAGFVVRVCNHAQLPQPRELEGAVVVFIRYVPAAWARLIEQSAGRLARLVLFMDDDVLDASASAGMPLRYRLKLARLAVRRKTWLKRQRAELWVATSFLQEKYADWAPQLVLPSPVEYADDVRRVFYHGSSSHGAEIRWLRPVMQEVLQRDERITFEIVGGWRVYRLYRDLPRVTVVNPMKWQAYQGFLAMSGRHIGLAPQLGSPFNRARSYTKLFDIVGCGAVGVFAADSRYSEVIRHGEDGLVADMTHQAWVEAILSLAGDDEYRQALLVNARATVRELAATADQAE